ncbi:carboxylesterase family protein [Parabacteroides sp. PF5-9]|uniref:carboxylesterase family protein n=1 Tax=Parabacteroides sp. PF5-9 TaxID=1742404 RepID=UPI0024764845|nr:carboxylesterase family protein [Parabacteroides sp. PF5-9]MDH6358555.1 para-nitrobenzyl esterase [Parabacteroides sp. PF5-9]
MKSFNRRSFIKGLGAGAAVITSSSVIPLAGCTATSSSDSSQTPNDDDQVLLIGDNIAIADTDCGKVKGFSMRGVYTFLGIPYAADASGKNRFMPPQKHARWDGIRPAVFYGNSAPQTIYSRVPTSYGAFVDHWNYDEISENCLTINIWTNGIADGKKRPVIVWLHGGGYRSGNGIEQDGYHGENITRYGDVVFCSINHRLGVIGFSDLSAVGGEKYKDSGNVGLLDMVEALKWVNRNIANFGGDPGNVTIIGQSGGGGKVCLLSACPEAKGLIHKAVPLSGSAITANDKAYSQKLGEYILKEARLTPAQIDKLQDLSWEEYMDIANKAAVKLQEDMGGPTTYRGAYGPIADDVYLPKGTFFEEPLPNSPDIPMLFCTTFHEQSPSRTDAELEKISKEGVVERLKSRYGDKTMSIVDAYAKNFPDAKPIELLAMITSNRQNVINAATAKKHQQSPVYMAWFGWCPPLFDNRMRAFHCLDICFWFLNTDLMLTHTGGGARPRKLSQKMADALLAFVRTGNPNTSSLPQWPEFTVENGETMILNDVCEVKNDPDREARSSLM